MQRALASNRGAATVGCSSVRWLNPLAGLLLGGGVACSALTSLDGLTGGAADKEGAPYSADGGSDVRAGAGVDAGEVADASGDCLEDACGTTVPRSDGEAGDARADAEAHADADVDAAASTDSAPPSIVRVQAVAPGWGSSDATTLTLVQENAGDLLVAGVYFTESTATITVADSLGNTWVPTTAYANTAACSSGQVSVAQIFYAGNILAGGNVVTVSQSSGAFPLGAFLVEYSGVRAAGPLNGVSGGHPASSTATMSAGSLTTTGAHDLVVALFAEATVYGVMTTGPGFSVVANDTTFYSMFEDDLPAGSGPGTVTPTAFEPGNAPSDCWVAAAAAFTAAP